MKRIIFLDIDGVITNIIGGWDNWNIYSVDYLKFICEEGNVKIVITSTWRKNHDKKFFKSILGKYLHKDYSTKILNVTRGEEVEEWLSRHLEVDEYLILDDDTDFTSHQKKHHFIHTNGYDGLLFKDFMKIREYFKIEKHRPMNRKIDIPRNVFGINTR